MSKLLEEALAEVYKLSDAEQDIIAAVILDELADEQRWDEQFAQSQEQLARLAEKARQDLKAGRARKAGFDELRTHTSPKISPPISPNCRRM